MRRPVRTSPSWRTAALAILAVLSLAPRSTPAHDSRIQTYTEQEGLPSSWVKDVTRGPDGRMWFLTVSGVAAYDGTVWETYDQERGAPLRRGFRFALLPDGSGWAAGNGGELYRFDGRVWSVQVASPIDSTRTEVTDFAVLETEQGAAPVVSTLGEGLYLLVDGRLVHLRRDAGLPGDEIHALLAVGDELLIGTDAGLWSWKGGKLEQRFVPPADLSPVIRGLAADGAPGSGVGTPILMVGQDWVGRLDESGFQALGRGTGGPLWMRYPQISVAADRRGGAYFGSAGALFHLDGRSGRIEKLDREDGLIGGGVMSFHRDREDNLWIATGVGVSKLAGTPFRNLDGDDGLFEDEVTAVAELSSGTVVLGHNEGLTLYRDGVERTIALPRESVPRVLDLERDKRDNLWVAGSGLGLLRVPPSGKVERIGRSGPNGSHWISSARFDDQGRLWLCGPRGIYRLEGSRIEQVPVPVEGLNGVRRIYRGPDGAMYFATGGFGVLIRREDRWIQARHETDNSANNVFAVLETADGRLLVGTHGGLFELRRERIVKPDAPLAGIEQPVYFLVEDGARQLWIGTNFGVFKQDLRNELRHFVMQHGLAGLETNRAAGFVDSRGRLWLGTDRGVSVLDRPWLEEDSPPLRVELLEAAARGKPFVPDAETRLRHDRNDLTFQIRAISFFNEREIRFRTRLAGLEEEWTVHDASPTRLVVRYPRLPMGSYRLEAQARNTRTMWSPVTRSGRIVIAPPFWLRGWFFGLVGGVLALAAFATHSYLSQRRYARRLEQEVRRYTRDLEHSRQAIEAERERLAAVLGNIGDGVIALDADDRVLLVNPAAERMLGLAEGAPAGRPFLDAVASRDDEERAALQNWLRELRETPPSTWSARPAALGGGDGNSGSLEFAAAPYRPSGTARPGMVLAIRDISERQRAEEERARTRRLEALGVLAGGIAHDFNNILTAILGNVSLVRDETRLEPAADARLREAESAIERAHRLALQLVTFAKGGAPATAPVSIGELLRQTAGFVFSGSGVRCSIRLPTGLWPAEVDSDQIQQVFENLLLNARQSIDGSGRVEVLGSNVDAPGTPAPPPLDSGRFVRIDVRDNGRGIRAEHVDRIFEPYFTTKSTGSGLGLATCYSIVRRHGGAMTVNSTLDEGTTFSVYLPASRQRPVAPERGERSRTPRRPTRVLVLEDEPSVGVVLQDLLITLGHEVEIARDGDEALDLCRRALEQGRRFEVAILDLTIPGGRGGAEIVAELAALDAGLCAIASSGYSEGTMMSRFADFGFATVLPKPYDLSQLDAAIERVLRGRSAPPPGLGP